MPRPTYCVIFKTHFWDDFVARQFKRICANSKNATVVIAVDETLDPVPVSCSAPVIRITTAKLAQLKLLPVTTHGSALWYNIDYPHYITYMELPRYDFYVTVEYDVVNNLNLDELVDELNLRGVDFLGSPIDGIPEDWAWFDMHQPIYGSTLLKYLSCFAVFSRRAIEVLLKRRQSMGEAFEAGRLRIWPNNEAFIPNEIARAGLSIESLSTFGPAPRYDWWPPTHEDAISRSEAFIHPVLTGERYTRSLLTHAPLVQGMLNPFGRIHFNLRRHARGGYAAIFAATLRDRIAAAFKRRLNSDVPWYAKAASDRSGSESTSAALG